MKGLTLPPSATVRAAMEDFGDKLARASMTTRWSSLWVELPQFDEMMQPGLLAGA